MRVLASFLASGEWPSAGRESWMNLLSLVTRKASKSSKHVSSHWLRMLTTRNWIGNTTFSRHSASLIPGSHVDVGT